MAGYAFGRLHFKGRDFCFLLVSAADDGSWTDLHHTAVSDGKQDGDVEHHFCSGIPWYGNGVRYFPAQTGVYGLPNDLEEAARLDGCNIGQTFLYIMAPADQIQYRLSLGYLYRSVSHLKILMWPMIVNTDKDMLVLSSALAKMQVSTVPNSRN